MAEKSSIYHTWTHNCASTHEPKQFSTWDIRQQQRDCSTPREKKIEKERESEREWDDNFSVVANLYRRGNSFAERLRAQVEKRKRLSIINSPSTRRGEAGEGFKAHQFRFVRAKLPGLNRGVALVSAGCHNESNGWQFSPHLLTRISSTPSSLI